jgi:hypothetical protein
MFTVTEAEAAAIRAAFDRGDEVAAAVELRRLFPAITDNAKPFDRVGGKPALAHFSNAMPVRGRWARETKDV